MLHIVMITSDGKGHWLPFYSIAASILNDIEDDVKITMILPQPASSTSAQHPADSQSLRTIMLPIPPEYQGSLGVFQWLFQCEDDAVEITAKLIKEKTPEDWPAPRHVLYDMMMSWGLILAERILHCEHTLLFVSPLGFFEAWCQGHYTPTSADSSTLVHIPSVGHLAKSEILICPEIDGTTQKFFNGIGERLRLAQRIFVNDSKCLYEGDASDLLRAVKKGCRADGQEVSIFMTGLWAANDIRLRADLIKPRADYLQWLDKQANCSVLFVAFGSWCPIEESDLEELAHGIKNSGVKCLWAYRNSTTTLKEILYSDGAEPDEHIIIREWINQPEVLRHRAVAGFLSHSGWNSLTEAITWAGCPILSLPLMAEQGMNAFMVEALWKIGVRLWKTSSERKLDRHFVRETITKTLSDTAIKNRAHDLHLKANSGWFACDGAARQEIKAWYKSLNRCIDQ